MSTTIHHVIASSWVDRLLGLRDFHWANAGVGFQWEHPLPGWGWVAVAVAATVFSAWSYRRLAGRRAVRGVLAAARCALLIVMAVLLIGPTMVLRQELIEPDTLLVMVDRSASMRIQDAPDPTSSQSPRVSRDQAVRVALRQHADVFGAQKLGRDRRVIWMGFDERAYIIDPPSAWPAPPDDRGAGGGTNLRSAIEQALDKASGTPVSGIVLFTDGRTPQHTGQDLVHTLQRQVAAVFPVPVGDPVGGTDLGIAHLAAPESAFANDTVPIDVFIDRDNTNAQTDADAHPIVVELIDATTGASLDQRRVEAWSTDRPVRLVGRSEAVGNTQWQVRVDWGESGVADSQQLHRQDLVPDNNTRRLSVRIVDRPIRVLYVEGVPRWEYRYLHSVLTREKSIESSVLLISADRDFPQEGDIQIAGFPRTPEELLRFDVVVLGDVPTTYFSTRQLELLKDHVASHSLGLIWIGGPRHTPDGYFISPLASLLPMRLPPGAAGVESLSGPIDVVVTPLARSLGVMHLVDDSEDLLTQADGWPDNLAPLTWAQEIDPLAPSAEVLAYGQLPSGQTTPLVARIRYGAGQSVYVATDETWRWRYGVGDLYFERFWVQLVRMLGRHRLKGQGRGAALTVSSRTVELGESVVVRLRTEPTFPNTGTLPRVTAHVSAPDAVPGPGGRRGGTRTGMIYLFPIPDGDNGTRHDQPATADYEALWRPDAPGRLLLAVNDPAVSDDALEATVEILRPDDEMRHPKPDHQRLRDLAEATEGAVVGLDDLPRLADLVPNRAKRTPNDITEPLWDAPLSFLVLTVLLTVEWLGRKLIRLV